MKDPKETFSQRQKIAREEQPEVPLVSRSSPLFWDNWPSRAHFRPTHNLHSSHLSTEFVENLGNTQKNRTHEEMRFTTLLVRNVSSCVHVSVIV